MCLIDSLDGDPEFLDETLRRARTRHRCGECGRTIAAGERYEVATGKWDGSIGRNKTCLQCAAAREWLKEECAGFIYGRVLEDLREHAEEIGPPHTSVHRLAAAMKLRWRVGRPREVGIETIRDWALNWNPRWMRVRDGAG